MHLLDFASYPSSRGSDEMYAVANVEKFLKDKQGVLEAGKVAAILERARQHGEPDGVLVSGSSADIWRDPELEKEFGDVLVRDVDHMDIGAAALRPYR